MFVVSQLVYNFIPLFHSANQKRQKRKSKTLNGLRAWHAKWALEVNSNFCPSLEAGLAFSTQFPYVIMLNPGVKAISDRDTCISRNFMYQTLAVAKLEFRN